MNLLRAFRYITTIFHLFPRLFQFLGYALDFALDFRYPGLVMPAGCLFQPVS